MPANTSRGYSYPVYTDPAAFAPAMQDLAQDIDTDIDGILDNMGDALNTPPSARATGSGNIALAAGVGQIVGFDTEVFDNGGLYTNPDNKFTIAVEGLYWISGSVLFDTNSGIRLVQVAVGGQVRGENIRQRSAATTSITVEAHCLAYCSVGTQIQLAASSTVACTATTRILTATRMTGTTAL